MILDQAFDLVPVDQLLPHPANPRRGDVDRIAESIDVNSFYGALIVQRSTGHVLAGNHRLLAAKQQGLEAVPVLWVDVDDERARRILLADNRTNDVATYDEQELVGLLTELDLTDAGLAGTGYSAEDLLALTESGKEELPPVLPPSDMPSEPPANPVTKLGDVWLLGPHRIICGDSRDYETVARLLDGQRVNMAFTSPPYASQRKYDESSGFKPIPPDEYADWFEDVQANVRAVLADDGSWFVNIKEHCDDGQRHLYVKDLTIAHVRRWGWRFVDELCWVDTGNGFPGGYVGRFKDAWEPVFHFSLGKGIKFNPLANAETSDHAFGYDPSAQRTMKAEGYTEQGEVQYKDGLARPSNVISINAGGGNGHSAAFPVGLPAWFIKAFSDEGDAIFDPFMGSGTTLIAAHQEGRVAYGTEISPAYCDVICRRYQEHTGVKPERLLEDGSTEPHDFT